MAERPTPEEDELGPRIVEGWKAIEPPAGFSQRALDALANRSAAPTAARAPRSQRLAWAVGLTMAATIAVLGLWTLGTRSAAAPSCGAHADSSRASIAIGGRAVAVAEPFAQLSWRIVDGAARVEQPAGNVFYRVDHGGPFAVTTPSGVVEVRGTCFRVEVMPVSQWREKWFAMVAGAAVTVTVVAVLEGAVLLRNDHGVVEASAGETVALVDGQPPQKAPAEGSAQLGGDAALPDGATLEELRERERAQRLTITQLESQLKRLKGKDKERSAADSDDGPPPKKFFDFTQDELNAMADRCELRYDVPAYALEEHPRELRAEEASELGLSEAERGHVNRVLGEGDAALVEQIRAIYIELTGDSAGARTLSLRNLQHEVFAKSTPQAMAEALEQLARERAGRAKPPASLDGTTPVERLLRALAVSGERFEKTLGRSLGRERASELRKNGVGFGRRTQAQCPDELE